MKSSMIESFFNSTLSLDEKVCEDDALKIKVMYERLIDLCPSFSSSNLEIKRDGTQYKGKIEILSPFNEFTVFANANCPINVFKIIENKIKRQLSIWRKNRFIKNNVFENQSQQEVVA